VELPSDVTFGGPDLDRMFVTSIAISIGGVEVRSPDAGALLSIDDTGWHGRAESRFRLSWTPRHPAGMWPSCSP
jgi:sugar lactone lactonase YvrE